MDLRKCMHLCAVAAFVSASMAASGAALAQGHGNGNGHGKGHTKHDDDQEKNQTQSYYGERDQEMVRAWYANHARNLPPGLAKKDRLPPGLEKQLETRGTLPPGLQKRSAPVPVELERQLPPPPPDCAHVFIGGNVVLLNRRTNLVLDVFAVAGP